ncbi:hypothetical protein [Desulfocastanea catecholica]
MQKETIEVLAREERFDSLCKEDISFQLVQDVYARIKKKKESKEKRYVKHFILKQNDLEQLFSKMNQLFEQYNIIAREDSVTVYHQDDQFETFSSIQRFSLYNSSNTIPIKSVEIEYNYLMRLPTSNEEKSYTVKVHIFSSLCKYEEYKKEDIPNEVRSSILSTSGYLKIEYVDYVVANTILNVVDGWFESLEEVTVAKRIKTIQKYSKWMPTLFEFSFVLLCLYKLAIHMQFFFSKFGETFANIALFVLIAIYSISSLARFGRFAGYLCSDYIMSLVPLARIAINNGDQKILLKYKSENKIHIIKAICSLAGMIATGLITCYIFQYLTT